MNALMTKIEWAAIEAEFGKQIKVKDAPILEAVQRISKKYSSLLENQNDEEFMGEGAKRMLKDYLAQPGTVKTLHQAISERLQKGQPLRAVLVGAFGAIIKLLKGFLQIIHISASALSGDTRRTPASITDMRDSFTGVNLTNFLGRLGIVGSIASLFAAALTSMMDFISGFEGFMQFFMFYTFYQGIAAGLFIWAVFGIIYFLCKKFTQVVEITYEMFDNAYNALVGPVTDAAIVEGSKIKPKTKTATESITNIRKKLSKILKEASTSETAISRGNFDKLHPGEKTFAQYHIDAYKLAIKYAKHAEREYQNGDYGDGKSNTKNGFSPKIIFDEADKHLDQLSKWFDEKTLRALGVLPT
jgi:hypothetical protein